MDLNQDVIEIVLNGDVELVIPRLTESVPDGKDKKAQTCRIIVSSSMLMTHSSMFRAMLAKNFQEGQRFNEDGRVSIAFPDDNLETVANLCALIHSRLNLLGDLHDSPQKLSAVVRLSEKWNTQDAISANMDRIAFYGPTEATDFEKLLQTMFLAFQIGAQGTFDLYCHHILYDRALEAAFPPWPAWADDVHFCFAISLLSSTRDNARLILLNAMCGVLAADHAALATTECSSVSCPGKVFVAVSEPEGFLAQAGFSPVFELGAKTMTQLRNNLNFWSRLKEHILDIKCSLCSSTYYHDETCDKGDWRYDLVDEGLKQAEDLLENINLCIACLKLGPWTSCEVCKKEPKLDKIVAEPKEIERPPSATA